ncbi:CD2-associated protein-like isoform X3 [Acipenser oxyrinchus oxyrinchus]|uniref:Osteoclast-stimulating factor 1 n=1 Tax=Acipenser oxyrinchus oxyrinchus TaxID=40147 RepID=A0AAD8GCF1_ACIOX|nr:CD2-associated protein-like isoform X3 [Acipenser oxyrinchus oxyrinchus]
MEVIVEYDYEAHHEDELTIRMGDIIRHVKRLEEEGWMEGDLNGKTGMFPDNFVKEIKTETEAKDEVQPIRRERGNVASLVQRMSIYGFPAGAFQPQSNHKSFKRRSKKRQCRVVFEYLPQNEDELELKVGDMVDINEEVEEGWWSGTMHGKSGLFPSNFVKEIEVSDDGEQNDVLDDSETNNKELPGAGPTTPTSLLLSPEIGNGAVAQPKKVRGVGFGDIFKEGSVKLKARLPSSESEERKLEKPLPSFPSSPKTNQLNMTDLIQLEGESKPKVNEYCKARFVYEGTNEDELSLKEGEIIQILSKDTGEPGWWRGEVNGKEGVFPDNFVTLVLDSEKDVAAPKVSFRSPPKPEIEDKPKKPPPPAKSPALKPEVPSADRKPPPAKPEEKGDKPIDQKPAKPAAPLVPPKKPIPPPGKGNILLRTGSTAPKRPEKPHLPPPVAKPNGEVPSIRPKSEFEPAIIRPKEFDLTSSSRPKSAPGGDSTDGDIDLMSFNDITSTSEKLSHPTTNRPKMPGRRLPTQFASSPNNDIQIEQVFKVEDEEHVKPKLLEFKKPSFQMPPTQSTSKPIAVHIPAHDLKPKEAADDENKSEIEELRVQINQILHDVELLKTQQKKEITDLRNDLDEEKEKRIALQMEIEKLKKTVQLT